jgi:hypothetical protein
VKLNLVLIAIFLGFGSVTLMKYRSLKTPVNHDQEYLGPLEQLTLQDASLILEARDQRFMDNDRLTRDNTSIHDVDLEAEQVRIRYEEVKFDRAITALRTRHSEDLRRVLLDGIDFSVLPEGSHARLREIAQEEGMLHTYERLLR